MLSNRGGKEEGGGVHLDHGTGVLGTGESAEVAATGSAERWCVLTAAETLSTRARAAASPRRYISPSRARNGVSHAWPPRQTASTARSYKRLRGRVRSQGGYFVLPDIFVMHVASVAEQQIRRRDRTFIPEKPCEHVQFCTFCWPHGSGDARGATHGLGVGGVPRAGHSRITTPHWWTQSGAHG